MRKDWPINRHKTDKDSKRSFLAVLRLDGAVPGVGPFRPEICRFLAACSLPAAAFWSWLNPDLGGSWDQSGTKNWDLKASSKDFNEIMPIESL